MASAFARPGNNDVKTILMIRLKLIPRLGEVGGLAVKFESMPFSSVTCLPSCFTLFCLCTANTHKSLLILNHWQMILNYSQNHAFIVSLFSFLRLDLVRMMVM